jgi:predicted nucleic-acid-binding protein
MIAVDTNILIRILTKDDPAQAKRASKLMEADDIFIPKTVILETEWVLRYAYNISRDLIFEALQRLFGLPNIHLEDPRSLSQALSWYAIGLDFADTLHLASSTRADRFATFDKTFAKKASTLTAMEILEP